ncbi:MAG: thymidine kinase [Candidatus Marinimicrobia bacterium]|nr:thymidine kinase [Candidatus Neomarinimicrobiota bacterium]|tara:strand:- start:104 stop:655 length:552 start_codon:yes stop_codon:yes gene_type:complete
MRLTPSDGGWIELVCGSMFSGKTEELIRRIVRAQIAKQKTAIFKPMLDNRYSSEDIVSHNNRKIKSIIVNSASEITDYIKDATVIGIDEAQFFDKSIVQVCKDLAANKKRVIIAGLEKDYLGKPFGSMPELMVESEYVTKVLAICVVCGNPANFSYRITSESSQILVGETDKYEARCRKCFKI